LPSGIDNGVSRPDAIPESMVRRRLFTSEGSQRLLTAPEDADADSEDDGSRLIAKRNPSGENKKEDIDNVLIISQLVSLVNVKFLLTKIILRKEETPARQFRSLESQKKTNP
jgi:hypothetical protein